MLLSAARSCQSSQRKTGRSRNSAHWWPAPKGCRACQANARQRRKELPWPAAARKTPARWRGHTQERFPEFGRRCRPHAGFVALAPRARRRIEMPIVQRLRPRSGAHRGRPEPPEKRLGPVILLQGVGPPRRLSGDLKRPDPNDHRNGDDGRELLDGRLPAIGRGDAVELTDLVGQIEKIEIRTEIAMIHFRFRKTRKIFSRVVIAGPQVRIPLLLVTTTLSCAPHKRGVLHSAKTGEIASLWKSPHRFKACRQRTPEQADNP